MQFYGTMVAPQSKGHRYHLLVLDALKSAAFKAEDGEFTDPSPRYPEGLSHIRRNLAAGPRRQAEAAIATAAAQSHASGNVLSETDALLLSMEVIMLGTDRSNT
jgi:hypothetical protein